MDPRQVLGPVSNSKLCVADRAAPTEPVECGLWTAEAGGDGALQDLRVVAACN